MTGKQLLELLQNTTTFTEKDGNKKEKSLENYRFCTKKENGWTSGLTIEQVLECSQIYIVKIDLADGTIELKIDNEAENDKTFATIEDFLKSIKELEVVNGYQYRWTILFYSKDIPIEITVKTARGNEYFYLFGTNLDAPGKKKPYGWNRVKDLIVEEITEINSSKKFVLRITAREQ